MARPPGRNSTVSNTPWRLHKVTSYEGGISTPAIARWPAAIPQSANGQFVREPAHLLKAADMALYAAKRSGRNCVRVFSGNPAPAAKPAA